MAKMNCRCGWQMSTVGDPNKVEHHILTDYMLDELYTIDVEHSPLTWNEVYSRCLNVWKCPECDRLYLFDDHDKVVKVWVVED